MGTFTVQGGIPLSGTVRVSGSKNAALPIIFASLITGGVSRIYNLPDITDVSDALAIIEQLGAKIWREGSATLIDTRQLSYVTPDRERVQKIRASTYLIGACLTRFGRAELMPFGGCAFSHRPIDIHLSAATGFGATLVGGALVADKLIPAEVSLRLPSVGATVNSLIIAAGIKGQSRIIGAAKEPHITALISYLKSAGADIRVAKDTLIVTGGNLHGGVAVIPGDMIEAGTYLAASIVTEGRVRVSGLDFDELSAFTSPLLKAGVIEEVADGALSLLGRPRREISVTTGAYPAFATDLQPIFSTVLAVSHGGSIEEQVWRTRFGYLDELARLGLSYALDGNCARIFKSSLHSGRARATDLRGGAAALILALGAEGQSIISSGELVHRGYDSLVEKLTALGANISYE